MSMAFDPAPAIAQARNMPGFLFAWCGQSQLVLGTDGELSGKGMSGLYYRGARFLSRSAFRINDRPLHLCSAGKSGFDCIEFFYVYPPVRSGATGGSGSGMIQQQEGISERGMDIHVRFIVHPSGLDIEFTATNRWDNEATFELQALFGADFISLDEAQGGEPSSETTGVDFVPGDNGCTLTGRHPELLFRTHVVLSPGAPWRIARDALRRDVRLRRGDSVRETIRIWGEDTAESSGPDQWAVREEFLRNRAAGLSRLHGRSPYTTLTNKMIDYLSSASLLDGSPDEWLAPSAGYPLYPFVFGRDALTSSWMSAMFDGGEAIEHVLNKLGRLQGTTIDEFRDEQPGRIVQQARQDPSARLGKTPFDRYYGDYASPLMFIISLAHLYAWSGDRGQVLKHWDRCKKILSWAERYGDIDGDGFLEYRTRSKYGPRHQGWKDSENAIVYENGELVEPPIATCELQGYYYAALQAAALFSTLAGSYRGARRYFERARRLKREFNAAFWIDDAGYVAMGLDRHKRRIRSRGSNMGHCLAAGIIDKEKVPHVVQALFNDDMYSGWGVRTLSTGNPSYNPLSYHLGSIWPVENATIALGLRRYGFDQQALRLITANYELAFLWENGHIPECIGGYDRKVAGHPGAYPRANPMQTWNAAGFGLFTHVMLGLQPVAPLRTLFVDPILPSWLPELTVSNLRLRGALVSIRFCRNKNGTTRAQILERTGKVHLLRQPPIDSLTSSLAARLGALFGIVK